MHDDQLQAPHLTLPLKAPHRKQWRVRLHSSTVRFSRPARPRLSSLRPVTSSQDSLIEEEYKATAALLRC